MPSPLKACLHNPKLARAPYKISTRTIIPQKEPKIMKRTNCLLIALALITSGPAFAQTSLIDQKQTIIVQTQDLNLSSPAGQERLNRRISAAIEQVCFKPDPRVVSERTSYRRCVAQAMAASAIQVSQINNKTYASGNSPAVLLIR
jgi:UrcA family protein